MIWDGALGKNCPHLFVGGVHLHDELLDSSLVQFQLYIQRNLLKRHGNYIFFSLNTQFVLQESLGYQSYKEGVFLGNL